jgi:hypothetical protein
MGTETWWGPSWGPKWGAGLGAELGTDSVADMGPKWGPDWERSAFSFVFVITCWGTSAWCEIMLYGSYTSLRFKDVKIS